MYKAFIKLLCVSQVIKKDLEDCEAHITALETLVSSSSANKTRYERLYGDWRNLYKAVRVRREGFDQAEVLKKMIL